LKSKEIHLEAGAVRYTAYKGAYTLVTLLRTVTL